MEEKIIEITKKYIDEKYRDEIDVVIEKWDNKMYIEIYPIAETSIIAEIWLNDFDKFIDYYNDLIRHFDLSFNLWFWKDWDWEEEINALIY